MLNGHFLCLHFVRSLQIVILNDVYRVPIFLKDPCIVVVHVFCVVMGQMYEGFEFITV